MDREHLKRIEEVFTAALDLPAEARGRYLEEACGDDGSLRREVDALLAADASSGLRRLPSSFLARRIEAAPVPMPESIGDYQILAEIDRGGMGIVYRARDRQLDRQVALKAILSGQFATRGEIDRFEREARAAAGLDHPHIVPIHEVGAAGGVHYFSMKLLEGGTLARPDCRLDTEPRGIARLVEKISRAVHHAHERGVLHRDLKPANILLDRDGEPHVADFGLARPLADGATLTLTGQIAGTASYMAPEQAAGEAKKVTVASDVYGLGAILYQMLTERPPFAEGTPLTTLRKVLEDDPPRPRALKPGVPLDLESICLRALEKNPARRYASAAALADDLGRFARGEPVEARAVGAVARGWRWSRRHPALASALVLVVILVTGAAAASLVLLEQGRKLRSYLAEARLNEAERSALVPAPGQRTIGLARLREVAGQASPSRLRSAAAACLALPDVEVEARAPVFTPDTPTFVFAPSLSRYARGESTGAVTVRAIGGEEPEVRYQLGSPGSVQVLAFSPDERVVAALDGQRLLWLHDWRRGEPILGAPLRPALTPGGPSAHALSFRGDSRRAAVADGSPAVTVVDLAERRTAGTINVSGPCRGVAWAPGGDRLAAVTGETVRIVETATGRVLRDLEQPDVRDTAWDRRGAVLGLAAWKEVHLWDVARGVRLRSLPASASGATVLAFSPREDLLATASWDYGLRLWDFAGRELLSFTGGESNRLQFTHDGARVGVFRRGETAGWWRLHSSAVLRSIQPALGVESMVSVHPEGRFVGLDGVHIWDQARDEIHRPTPEGVPIYSVFTSRAPTIVSRSPGGVFLSPVALRRDEAGDAAGEVLQIGPPRLIQAGAADFAATPDGRHLACKHASEITLYEDGRKVGAFQHLHSNWFAISPDGRWLASGPLHGADVRIWDTRGGAGPIIRRPGMAVVSAAPVFSPDGRWLVLAEGPEVLLFRTGELSRPVWRQARDDGRDLPQPMAVSPDSSVLAWLRSPGGIELTDLRSLESLVTLRLRDPVIVGALEFSIDGARLLARTRDHGLHVWDLRRLRAELAALGLDWDAPPYPPPRDFGDPPPLKVVVDMGEFGGK
jgi:WD40 repeat protein